MMNPEMGGMRPTILLLREGTDESQVGEPRGASLHAGDAAAALPPPPFRPRPLARARFSAGQGAADFQH